MSIADWIEGLAPSGRYTFSKEDVRKAFPAMSAPTVDTALHRAVAKGRVFSPCRGFYVVVPEEYRLWKAVPQERNVPSRRSPGDRRRQTLRTRAA